MAWRTNVGRGYSSVAVREQLLYTMGGQDNQDIVRCLKAQTGEEVWQHAYACKSVPSPGTRSTPTLDAENLYTLSARGVVLCLDARNGTAKWQRDIVADKQAKIPFYGCSGSPCVEGELLVLNAGRGGLALDKQTGQTVWASEPEQGGYATPVIRETAGRRVAVIFGQEALHAVDVRTGERQWSYPWDTDFDSSTADPLVSGQTVFVSSCYEKGNVNADKGCALLDLAAGEPKPAWQNLNMRSHFGSCVALSGYAYGFDGRAGDMQIVSVFRQTGPTLDGSAPLGTAHVVFGQSHWVHDLREDMALGKIDRGWDQGGFMMNVIPSRATFYALLPRELLRPALELAAPQVAPGRTAVLRLSVPGAAGLHALKLTATRPDGKPADYWEQVVIVGREPKQVDLPVAYNDPAGVYTLTVRDVFDRKTPHTTALTVR